MNGSSILLCPYFSFSFFLFFFKLKMPKILFITRHPLTHTHTFIAFFIAIDSFEKWDKDAHEKCCMFHPRCVSKFYQWNMCSIFLFLSFFRSSSFSTLVFMFSFCIRLAPSGLCRLFFLIHPQRPSDRFSALQYTSERLFYCQKMSIEIETKQQWHSDFRNEIEPEHKTFEIHCCTLTLCHAGFQRLNIMKEKKKKPEAANLRTAQQIYIYIGRQSTNWKRKKRCEQSDRSTGAFIDCYENWFFECKNTIIIQCVVSVWEGNKFGN